jgi:hypothetical protein
VHIRNEQYRGYRLALDRENNLYKVQIFDRAGNQMASSGFAHTEAESALAEAQRIVDAYRDPRR